LNGRLLVLSFHAPPESAVGGLRWSGLSRHLAARGWQVRVITASPGAGDVRVPARMEVQVVERRTTLQDSYREWRRRQRGSGSPSGPRGNGGSPVDSGGPGRGWFRSSGADLLSFPDHGRGWVIRAAGATRAAVRDWAPDIVVSTGPPHSVHLAAGLALRGTALPWVVDLRDPWVTPWHAHAGTGWSLAVARRLERSVFRRAATILTTTPELRELLRAHYPESAVVWLSNGVDTAELPDRSAPPAGLTVTHLGSVYFNRDPTPVLRAFAAFLARCPAAAAAGARLRFVGSVSRGFRPVLEEALAGLDILSHVEVAGTLSRERALDLLASSHMALVLAQGQDVMVPAKLYEAVALGLPTLVVTEPDSATAREARRVGAAVHGPEDETGMASTFERVWSGSWNADGVTRPRVDHAYLAGELESILQGLLRQRPSMGP
jgi:hypothetical protein